MRDVEREPIFHILFDASFFFGSYATIIEVLTFRLSLHIEKESTTLEYCTALFIPFEKTHE